MSMVQTASAANSDAVFVRHGRAIRLTAIAALIFATAVAAELPRMLSDLLYIYAPVYSFVVPPFAVLWTPVLLIALWFNSMVRGSGRFLFQMEPAFVAAAVLILSLIVLETAHALVRAEPPSFEVVFEFFWALFVFVVLRSFSYLRGWPEIMLITAALCAAVISLGSIVFPFRSVMDLGIGEFFRSPLRPMWDGINSHSYFAAIIVIVSLHSVFFVRKGSYFMLFWATMGVVNLAGVAANKSRGAWIAVLAGVALLSIARITGWSGRALLLAGLALGVSAASLILAFPMPIIDAILSLGRGLSPAAELTARGYDVSEIIRTGVIMRTEMIATAMELFRHSPLVGHGWAEVQWVRVAGHGIHGIPQLVAASYGLVGLSLVVATAFIMLRRGSQLIVSPLAQGIVIILLIATLTRSSVPLWFAIVFSLLATLPDQEVLRTNVSKKKQLNFL